MTDSPLDVCWRKKRRGVWDRTLGLEMTKKELNESRDINGFKTTGWSLVSKPRAGSKR